jgi:hypothetical protein
MTIPTLSPAPATTPNIYGGDPAAFDAAMQAWLTWEATRSTQDPAFLSWIDTNASTIAALANAAQLDRILCAAAQAAVTAQSPVINAAAAAAAADQALAYASLAQAAVIQEIYPAWNTGSYLAGDRVVYNSKNYECIQSYTTTGIEGIPPQAPQSSPSYWLRLDFTNQGGPIRLNARKITADFTVPTAYNAASAGPIAITEGVTVTIEDNATWSIH